MSGYRVADHVKGKNIREEDFFACKGRDVRDKARKGNTRTGRKPKKFVSLNSNVALGLFVVSRSRRNCIVVSDVVGLQIEGVLNTTNERKCDGDVWSAR